jgi:hypothetical protein
MDGQVLGAGQVARPASRPSCVSASARGKLEQHDVIRGLASDDGEAFAVVRPREVVDHLVGVSRERLGRPPVKRQHHEVPSGRIDVEHTRAVWHPANASSAALGHRYPFLRDALVEHTGPRPLTSVPSPQAVPTGVFGNTPVHDGASIRTPRWIGGVGNEIPRRTRSRHDGGHRRAVTSWCRSAVRLI